MTSENEGHHIKMRDRGPRVRMLCSTLQSGKPGHPNTLPCTLCVCIYIYILCVCVCVCAYIYIVCVLAMYFSVSVTTFGTESSVFKRQIGCTFV